MITKTPKTKAALASLGWDALIVLCENFEVENTELRDEISRLREDIDYLLAKITELKHFSKGEANE